MMQSPWKTVWQFLLKLNIHLPAIPLLDIYPKEMRTYVHKKTYIKMFIAALFIIAKKQKYPNAHQYQKENEFFHCGMSIQLNMTQK